MYDTLSKNNEFADWTYMIFSSQTLEARIPDYTQAAGKAGVCPLTAKIYFFNEQTNSWGTDFSSTWTSYGGSNSFVGTSNVDPPTAGTLTVDFQDVTTHPVQKPYTEWYVKITIEDERAENKDNNAYLEYFLTL